MPTAVMMSNLRRARSVRSSFVKGSLFRWVCRSRNPLRGLLPMGYEDRSGIKIPLLSPTITWVIIPALFIMIPICLLKEWERETINFTSSFVNRLLEGIRLL